VSTSKNGVKRSSGESVIQKDSTSGSPSNPADSASPARTKRLDWFLVFAHPFLISVAPIAALYAVNFEEADNEITFNLVGLAIVGTLGLFVIFRLLLGNLLRAASATSLFNVLFYSYGWIFEQLKKQTLLDLTDTSWHLAVGLFSLAVMVVAIIILRHSRRDLRPFSRFLTGTISLVLLITIYNVIFAENGRKSVENPFFTPQNQQLHAKYSPAPRIETDTPEKPDIYYIILDAYARHDVMKNVLGYDNSEFINFLKSRGFYVAEQSCANFPYTLMSLSSSLNMQYFEDVYKQEQKWSRRVKKKGLIEMIQRPLIARIMQSKGYQYIHYATNCTLTETSDYADRLITYNPLWMQSEFSQVLLRFTPLRIFEPNIAYMHLNAFSEMKEMHKIPGPKFMFFHMICPHRPYVFEKDGTIRFEEPQDLVVENETGSQARLRRLATSRQQYVDQVTYLNSRMQEVIDHILANSKNPPIIILHSDHGSASLAGAGRTQNMKEENFNIYARERLPILNAYYVPKAMRNKLYPTISPANSFRLMLSECFGENFELLPDRSWIGWYAAAYDLREATEIVKLGAPTPDEVVATDDLNSKRRSISVEEPRLAREKKREERRAARAKKNEELKAARAKKSEELKAARAQKNVKAARAEAKSASVKVRSAATESDKRTKTR
jgi:hypothetical protein